MFCKYSLFLFILLFSGCALFDNSPNMKTYYKDFIRIDGSVKYSTKDVKYFHIYTDLSGGKIKLPEVYIELSNSEKVLLSKLTVDFLLERGQKDLSATEYTEWPKDAFGVYLVHKDKIATYSFIIRQKEILEFSSYNAIFWDKEQKKRYVLPISYTDAVELFGEPDKVIDWFTW